MMLGVIVKLWLIKNLPKLQTRDGANDVLMQIKAKNLNLLVFSLLKPYNPGL